MLLSAFAESDARDTARLIAAKSYTTSWFAPQAGQTYDIALCAACSFPQRMQRKPTTCGMDAQRTRSAARAVHGNFLPESCAPVARLTVRSQAPLVTRRRRTERFARSYGGE